MLCKEEAVVGVETKVDRDLAVYAKETPAARIFHEEPDGVGSAGKSITAVWSWVKTIARNAENAENVVKVVDEKGRWQPKCQRGRSPDCLEEFSRERA
jgi:hypothetical protein